MTEKPDLSQILADAREEAQVLRANGAGFAVDRVETLLGEIAGAAEEWTTWLSEGDAAMRSGYSKVWLRGRFEAWLREGHARLDRRNRQYRACVVPRRANTVTANTRGRNAARLSRKAS